MFANQTDIMIIGAGPTGLALAITLQQAGIPYVLVDKLAQGQNTSRAAVIHAHTLDVLGSLGITPELVKRGLALPAFAIRDRDRSLLNLRFDQLQSQHPYVLMVTQDVTEQILAERLAALGGTIHRGVSATAVTQTASGVSVSLASAEGDHTIRARYVVGADGMHSIVRTAAGIAFEGAPYAESFVLADVRMDWPLGDSEVSLFFSAAGMVVVAPLPDGSYRVVATLDHAPERPDAADIQRLIDARGPAESRGTVKEVIWSSRFRVHHRLAAAYRNDRVFLVGDAAHVHSPAGGQGMNCGLVDACVLGELLSDVIRGRRPEASLDSYEALRRPAAAEVLGLAGRLTMLATMRNPLGRAVRNVVFSIINHLRPVKRRLAMGLSGLSRRRLALLPPREDGAPPRKPISEAMAC